MALIQGIVAVLIGSECLTAPPSDDDSGEPNYWGDDGTVDNTGGVPYYGVSYPFITHTDAAKKGALFEQNITNLTINEMTEEWEEVQSVYDNYPHRVIRIRNRGGVSIETLYDSNDSPHTTTFYSTLNPDFFKLFKTIKNFPSGVTDQTSDGYTMEYKFEDDIYAETIADDPYGYFVEVYFAIKGSTDYMRFIFHNMNADASISTPNAESIKCSFDFTSARYVTIDRVSSATLPNTTLHEHTDSV